MTFRKVGKISEKEGKILINKGKNGRMIDFFFLLLGNRNREARRNRELLYSSNYSMIRSLEKVS